MSSAPPSARHHPQQLCLPLSSSSQNSGFCRTSVSCDNRSALVSVAPSSVCFSTLHHRGRRALNVRQLTSERLHYKLKFSLQLISDASDYEMNNWRTSKRWQRYRVMGTAKAAHSPSSGPDSNLAMSKSDIDSCLWLNSSEQCSGGSDSGSLVQTSNVSSNTTDGAIDNQTVGKADLMSKSSESDFHHSIKENSIGIHNGRATAARISAHSLKTSTVVTSPGASVGEYRIVDEELIGKTQSWIYKAEAGIERAIFDCRFLALLAIAGSLAGSLLCFLKGCVFIVESYVAFWHMCMIGVHTGKMVLRLIEAVDVYLVGTVLLIFGMGLYGLFISNVSHSLEPSQDRALQNSSLFGMFVLKVRPKWMQITSLDELKTKLGHVIVMILLVKMFERSKAVTISSGTELLSYSVSIFLASASLFVLHRLHN